MADSKTENLSRSGVLPWQTWCAPVALVAIALSQIGRVYTRNLTPWKGGGFGMFSTTDALTARYIKVFLIEEGREIPASIPRWLRSHAEKLQAEPNEERLRYLAHRLAGEVWVNEQTLRDSRIDMYRPKGKDIDPKPPRAIALDRKIDRVPETQWFAPNAVRVELWRMRYAEKQPLTLRGEPWLSTKTQIQVAP